MRSRALAASRSAVGWLVETAKLIVGFLAVRVAIVAGMGLALVGFGALLLVLYVVLSPLGVSERAVGTVAGVLTIVGVWVVGLRIYFSL